MRRLMLNAQAPVCCATITASVIAGLARRAASDVRRCAGRAAAPAECQLSQRCRQTDGQAPVWCVQVVPEGWQQQGDAGSGGSPPPLGTCQFVLYNDQGAGVDLGTVNVWPPTQQAQLAQQASVCMLQLAQAVAPGSYSVRPAPPCVGSHVRDGVWVVLVHAAAGAADRAQPHEQALT